VTRRHNGGGSWYDNVPDEELGPGILALESYAEKRVGAALLRKLPIDRDGEVVHEIPTFEEPLEAEQLIHTVMDQLKRDLHPRPGPSEGFAETLRRLFDGVLFNHYYQALPFDLQVSLYDKLLLFAARRCRTVVSVGAGPVRVHPDRMSPRDLVQEAFARSAVGRRRWNCEEIDCLPFLFGVVKSLNSEELRRTSSNGEKYLSSLREATPEDAQDDWIDELLSRFHGPAPTPEEVARAKQLVLSILKKATTDDPDLHILTARLLHGYKPREIAEDLERAPEAVYQDIRKLRRRVTRELGASQSKKPKEQ
jgi:RNA polymerase sigma factor (sigma-70 family)